MFKVNNKDTRTTPMAFFWYLLKNGTTDLQNSPSFERLTCFYVTVSESFKRFQYFNVKTNFLENGNLFQKTVVPFIS